MSNVAIYPVYLAPDCPAFLGGVPAVPLSVDAELAERLVRTGAFALERDPFGVDADPLELSDPELEAATARLDFYDPPLAHGAHYVTPERVNPERLEPEARAVLAEAIAARAAGAVPIDGGGHPAELGAVYEISREGVRKIFDAGSPEAEAFIRDHSEQVLDLPQLESPSSDPPPQPPPDGESTEAPQARSKTGPSDSPEA